MYRRYKWKYYRKTGIEFSRDIKDVRSKESLKLYDKGTELKVNAESRKFLSMLTNHEEIENHFDGMVRFEISLTSTAKIQEFLNIQDTYINKFFKADANPILDMFDKIFSVKSNHIDFQRSTYNEWSMGIIYDYFHGDLKRIEQNIRNVYDDRKGAYSRMKQFEQVKTKKNNTFHIFTIIYLTFNPCNLLSAAERIENTIACQFPIRCCRHCKNIT